MSPAAQTLLARIMVRFSAPNRLSCIAATAERFWLARAVASDWAAKRAACKRPSEAARERGSCTSGHPSALPKHAARSRAPATRRGAAPISLSLPSRLRRASPRADERYLVVRKAARSKTHTTCRRCGKVSFHLQKKVCASCGYPGAKMRRFNWSSAAEAHERHGPHASHETHAAPLQERLPRGYAGEGGAESRRRSAAQMCL